MHSEEPDLRKKRLRMLASQRGSLEVELALRPLVKDGLAQWGEEEFNSLETLLNMGDLDLWEVICGRRRPPEGAGEALLERLKKPGRP
jgi:succinate dehydrogenase flavin-adding protein (antitoxin of CptAB toxin-antitoxin module)